MKRATLKVSLTQKGFINHAETFLIIPLMLVAVLASCGAKTINDAEGIALAKKIQTFHEESSFAYNSDKITFKMTTKGISGGAGDTAFEARFSKDEYTYYIMSTTNATDSASNKTISIYTYAKDGTYYSTLSDGTSMTYSTLSQSEFNTMVNAKQTGIRTLIHQMAEGAYGLLKTTVASIEASSTLASSTASTDGVNPYITGHSFASTGEGNLTATIDEKQEDNGVNVVGHEVMVFDHSYPISVQDIAKGSQSVSASTETIDSTEEMTFGWGECTPLYPDLSQYTKK